VFGNISNQGNPDVRRAEILLAIHKSGPCEDQYKGNPFAVDSTHHEKWKKTWQEGWSFCVYDGFHAKSVVIHFTASYR
jgi:hypothetical protein